MSDLGDPVEPVLPAPTKPASTYLSTVGPARERPLPGTGAVSLPSMADLDELAHELDAVDSVLAELDQTPA